MEKDVQILIERFNANVEWLVDNYKKGNIVFTEAIQSDTVGVPEAVKFLGRGRTWISARMIVPEKVTEGLNTDQYLLYGVDWYRESSRIVFKRESLIRFKNEMRAIGEKYQRRISGAEA
jgi:hypothetical protein